MMQGSGQIATAPCFYMSNFIVLPMHLLLPWSCDLMTMQL